MVDIAMIDPERAAQIMGKKPESEPADGFSDLIPAYARIQVQIGDKTSLDDCADILAGLAQQLRFLARRHDITQAMAKLSAWRLIKSANASMQDSTRYRSQK